MNQNAYNAYKALSDAANKLTISFQELSDSFDKIIINMPNIKQCIKCSKSFYAYKKPLDYCSQECSISDGYLYVNDIYKEVPKIIKKFIEKE